MKRGKEIYSSKTVTIFLLGAVLISLVSTWTVLVTLNDVTSNKEATNKPPQEQQLQAPTGGVISLIVLPREEPINATKQ